MLCNKCGFEGNPNLEETGPHTKATCRKCNAYLKMISKKELETLTSGNPSEQKTDLMELNITITNIEVEKIPKILERIRCSYPKGFVESIQGDNHYHYDAL